MMVDFNFKNRKKVERRKQNRVYILTDTFTALNYIFNNAIGFFQFGFRGTFVFFNTPNLDIARIVIISTFKDNRIYCRYLNRYR